MSEQSEGPGGVAGAYRALTAKRAKLVSAAHSPLGFCVLALLIVEAFIWGAGVWFGLPMAIKIAALAVGVLLFVGVFATVVWLVVKYPKNLVFSEESHVRVEELRVQRSKDIPQLPSAATTKTAESGDVGAPLLEAPRPDAEPSDGESDNAD
ncbi:hypothetical protein [Paraburkholderia sp. A3RO-2L]|uniref:hypothetical protein n=1 Tax=Paraburkholderia sp. A3RO-2L TaxID=3028376 RepID=UPI003DA9647F